jgi:DNA-binding MarR family transcriptional regulator
MDAHEPSFAELGKELARVNLLSRSSEMISRMAAMSALELPQHLYFLFTRVALHAPIELRDVAATIAVDNSTVTRWVLQLVGLGLIDKQPSVLDSRRHVLRLTAEGEAAWHRLSDAWAAFFAEALAAWSPGQVQHFVQSLTELVTAVHVALDADAPALRG